MVTPYHHGYSHSLLVGVEMGQRTFCKKGGCYLQELCGTSTNCSEMLHNTYLGYVGPPRLIICCTMAVKYTIQYHMQSFLQLQERGTSEKWASRSFLMRYGPANMRHQLLGTHRDGDCDVLRRRGQLGNVGAVVLTIPRRGPQNQGSTSKIGLDIMCQ